ncbi:MAG: glycerol kinase GlpK [Victivallaceae bacterium]|nr:glycerol kinase GlpK [Victivallaceae bacterium]
MISRYILALDASTSSSRAIIFDRDGGIVALEQYEFEQLYPQAGWVEHDPVKIWQLQRKAIRNVLLKSGLTARNLAAVGITNQRETAVVWNRRTGKPVYNAIVWQCRRTAAECEKLAEDGLTDYIRENTGLVPDAYFSGTKIKWILDHAKNARQQAENGELLFGTIDTWLLWKLTGGKVHATDYSNASRTMIYNINRLCWDQQLLDRLRIPPQMLPEAKPSSGIFGYAALDSGSEPVPVAGIAGDQQAAMFGHGCFYRGMAKNTYGTGCFLLLNTGSKKVNSNHGLITTLLASDSKTPQYALEGSVFMGGAIVQWLRDELKIIKRADEIGPAAAQVPDTGGVYLVPAFAGLGAPYWDMYARGAIVGLTRGTGRNHLIRAAEEAIAYQNRDIIEAVQQDADIKIAALKVDGGATRDDFLLQFQADILGIPLERPQMPEITAWGAALLAGLAVGYWQDKDAVFNRQKQNKIFFPQMPAATGNRLYQTWKRAVDRARGWAIKN